MRLRTTLVLLALGLVARPALADSLAQRLPHISQYDPKTRLGDKRCVPASQAMVVRAFGLKTHLGKEDLVREVDALDGAWNARTSLAHWDEHARALGLHATRTHGSPTDRARQIVEHLDAGGVTLVNVGSAEAGHAVVVSEHHDGKLLLHDPLELRDAQWIEAKDLPDMLRPSGVDWAFHAYTLAGAAERLGLSTSEVRDLMASGRLVSAGTTDAPHISARVVEHFLDEHRDTLQRGRLQRITNDLHAARDAELDTRRATLEAARHELSALEASTPRQYAYDAALADIDARIAERQTFRGHALNEKIVTRLTRYRQELERHGAAGFNTDYAQALYQSAQDLHPEDGGAWDRLVAAGPAAYPPTTTFKIYDKRRAELRRSVEEQDKLLHARADHWAKREAELSPD